MGVGTGVELVQTAESISGRGDENIVLNVGHAAARTLVRLRKELTEWRGSGICELAARDEDSTTDVSHPLV